MLTRTLRTDSEGTAQRICEKSRLQQRTAVAAMGATDTRVDHALNYLVPAAITAPSVYNTRPWLVIGPRRKGPTRMCATYVLMRKGMPLVVSDDDARLFLSDGHGHSRFTGYELREVVQA
ncbi:hypothetical protein ACFYO0_40690 [Streptomyces sp. NPDC006365]|uniref:hypothetical protein n=1 Tax=Streptomyces sp. NPDC006365 TaxID=3364744 RepID=UPI0036BC9421